MSFDQVTGRIDFNRGQLVLAEPFKVESASTQLKLAGNMEVATQNVNATLVATLPVSGNLTLAAAMTGALPVAAGVFIAGKIFKNNWIKPPALNTKCAGLGRSRILRCKRFLMMRPEMGWGAEENSAA